MIDTLTTAAASTVARGAELVHQTAALPARGLDLARQVNLIILTGPSSTTAPTTGIPSVNIEEPPGGEKIMTIVGWVGWTVFVAAVTGVLIICIKMAISAHRNRSGDGGEEAGKLFWPLLACIVGSSAGAIVGAVA